MLINPFDDPHAQWLVGKYSTTDEIQALTKETCETCGIMDIYPDIEWKFEKRFKTTLGEASYWADSEGKNYWLIKYSSLMWLPLGDTGRKNTVVHEVCHLAVERLYGHCSRPKKGQERVLDHGKHWQDLMKKCGEDPFLKVCHGNEI